MSVLNVIAKLKGRLFLKKMGLILEILKMKIS